jgi:hypothetical protein
MFLANEAARADARHNSVLLRILRLSGGLGLRRRHQQSLGLRSAVCPLTAFLSRCNSYTRCDDRGYRPMLRAGGRTACARPGFHAAVRCPAIYGPDRLAGHRLHALEPMPVPLERGTEKRQGRQVQDDQENASYHVPPQECFDPDWSQASEFSIAPFHDAGTLNDRSLVSPESAELPANAPGEAVACQDGPNGGRRGAHSVAAGP